jgi:hypothetical protein
MKRLLKNEESIGNKKGDVNQQTVFLMDNCSRMSPAGSERFSVRHVCPSSSSLSRATRCTFSKSFPSPLYHLGRNARLRPINQALGEPKSTLRDASATSGIVSICGIAPLRGCDHLLLERPHVPIIPLPPRPKPVLAGASWRASRMSHTNMRQICVYPSKIRLRSPGSDDTNSVRTDPSCFLTSRAAVPP